MELCKKMISLSFTLDVIHVTIPVIGLCNALNIEDLKLDHGLNLTCSTCSEGFSSIL